MMNDGDEHVRLRAWPKPLRPRLLIRLTPRNRGIEYRLGYLGAMTEMSYKAKKRPNKTFHFGLVGFHHGFAIRTGRQS